MRRPVAYLLLVLGVVLVLGAVLADLSGENEFRDPMPGATGELVQLYAGAVGLLLILAGTRLLGMFPFHQGSDEGEN
jgi:hypothetical protein